MHANVGRPLASRPHCEPGTRLLRQAHQARRRPAGLLPLLALALVALSPALAAAQPATPPPVATPVAGDEDFAGPVDFGDGRRLYLECRGSGSPAVILEAGYRSPATVWTDDLVQPDDPREMVFEAVASFTRVCAYERPGVAAVLDGRLIPSRSDPVPMPRTVDAVVADLHALLQAAEIPGPYVLVGHSLGGLLVRLYAATYPDEVAGMVLVDALPEQLRNHLSADDWATYLAANAILPPEMAGYAGYETIDFGAAVETMTGPPSPTPYLRSRFLSWRGESRWASPKPPWGSHLKRSKPPGGQPRRIWRTSRRCLALPWPRPVPITFNWRSRSSSSTPSPAWLPPCASPVPHRRQVRPIRNDHASSGERVLYRRVPPPPGPDAAVHAGHDQRGITASEPLRPPATYPSLPFPPEPISRAGPTIAASTW